MNVILTRIKDEHLNMCWEPFATSTPLKPRSSNAGIVSVPQMQLLIHNKSSDFLSKPHKSRDTANVLKKESSESNSLISKKTRKKKSLTYFDLTSSSDEDSPGENKKRPVIKLRSRRKIKSILVKKNSSSEKINTNEEISNGKKLEVMGIKDCGTNAVCDTEKLKLENIQSYSNKSRASNDALKSGSNFIDISSDEVSKIFDGTKMADNILEDTALHLVNKEKTIINCENVNSNNLNVLDGTGKKVLKEILVTHPVFKKNVYKNRSSDSKNISLCRNSEFNKSCKSQKRKCKGKSSTTNISKKTRTKKANTKLVSNVVDMPIESSGSLLHIWESKTNLLHQLFSDSREQELINILDLTSEEVDEKVKNMESSLMQKKKKLTFKSCNSSHPSINKSPYECEQKPKRKKKNLKKYIISENSSNESLQSANIQKKIKSERNSQTKFSNYNHISEFHIQRKSKNLSGFSDGVNAENFLKNVTTNLKAQKKPKRKIAYVFEENKTSTINELLNESMKSDKLRSTNVSNVFSPVESNTENNKINSNKALVPKEIKKAVNKKKPVFKLLKELSYKESEMGCSVAQGWSTNHFKCGVFKLKVNSQMSCKTLHRSSNFGGVLMKGDLRMKIGDKEFNLTEGDMVFVPPLTEWLATNIGKCETLFYYWCGSFNA